MNRTLWFRLMTAARTMIPAGLAFGFALAGSIPLTAMTAQILKPLLPFAAVYYWALYRPDLLPAPIAFVLGLLVDVLSGAPIGVCAATFTLAHGVLCRQRRFLIGRSFIINWMGFALVAAGSFVLVWVLTSILHGAPVPATALLFQVATTVAAFPLVFWLLHRCHTAIVGPV